MDTQDRETLIRDMIIIFNRTNEMAGFGPLEKGEIEEWENILWAMEPEVFMREYAGICPTVEREVG